MTERRRSRDIPVNAATDLPFTRGTGCSTSQQEIIDTKPISVGGGTPLLVYTLHCRGADTRRGATMAACTAVAAAFSQLIRD